MKRIVLVILILACCLNATDAQVRFGIKGGMNFENFDFKDARNELTVGNAIGWQAGALLQFKIPVVGLGLQPELLYTVKKGDTLSAIAKKNSTTVSALAKLNNIANPDAIDIGQVLIIKKATTSTSTKSTPYTIKVAVNALNIRKDASTKHNPVGVIRDRGVYTITEEKNGWGKLKSGAGWIHLEYTTKIK